MRFLQDSESSNQSKQTNENKGFPFLFRHSIIFSICACSNLKMYHMDGTMIIFSNIYSCFEKGCQLKSIKTYATIPKGMMGCGCSLLHRQVHEFSARWKAKLRQKISTNKGSRWHNFTYWIEF